MNKITVFGCYIILTGCSLAPTYQPPQMPIPEHFKETGTWIKIKSPPRIVKINAWWEVFHDPILNSLEERLTVANEDLNVAFSRYQEAIADAQAARSYFFPTLQSIFNADRQRNSSNVNNVINSPNKTVFNQYLIGGFLNYELDAWGAIRNTFIANTRLAQASEANVATANLSLHAELAYDYLALRGREEQLRIINKTVVAYQKAFDLTKRRFRGGISPIGDVDEAQTQLENAKTMAADIQLKRTQLEHAIAVLIGEIPSNFSIDQGKLPNKSLTIIPSVPSTLLTLRPDIVASELRVQAANANIGVARAAFFPQFNLTGTVGFQSQSLANLISKPSLFWSLGPLSLLSLTQPVAQLTVFDGGKLFALLRKANAKYYEAVATYRQTVLKAFQDVENSLAAIRQLEKELRSQEAAYKAALRALRQEKFRYQGGIITFLQVVVVENTALQSELAFINIRTQQQIACVQLIKALGGRIDTLLATK